MGAAFYIMFAFPAVFAAGTAVYIAWYPVYKLTGGGDTFLQYIDYLFKGPKV